MTRIDKIISVFNFNTIVFNFKYLPLKKAVKFPFLLSRNVYFKKLKGTIEIDAPVFFGMIKIGLGEVGIFDKKTSNTIWNLEGKITFKGRASIGHGSKIYVKKRGKLTFGENFTITAESSIIASNEIVFGTNCLMSWDCLIMDTDFHKIKNEQGTILNNDAPIVFGNNIWIGCRSIVLKGSSIPNNCVIGANSFVSKKLESENCLYVGNPIKCVKENIKWEL